LRNRHYKFHIPAFDKPEYTLLESPLAAHRQANKIAFSVSVATNDRLPLQPMQSSYILEI
jgi:hypothetical protein